MKIKKKLIIWGNGQCLVLEIDYKIEVLIIIKVKAHKKIKIFYGKSGLLRYLIKTKFNFVAIVSLWQMISISKFLVKKIKIISAINTKSNISSNVVLGKGVQILGMHNRC